MIKNKYFIFTLFSVNYDIYRIGNMLLLNINELNKSIAYTTI